ncbi:lantibiotic dehydratase [Streptomyces montanus]|uniref:lantibiotic dehydratase n=1 Tax=Streptomyces montanus TaxID=2580423 RepID=UPI001486A118|nr:lantibiotic dehydratase [Streptomyces montanus]
MKESEELSDLLYTAIGGLGNPSFKPRLVALRRSIHGMRLPARREWGEELARALPRDTSERIERWQDNLHRQRDARRELAAAVEQDRADETARLFKIAADPVFRHALSQASPTLLDELERCRPGGRARLKRRTVVGLTKFASRAATKTSPYSTFTATAAGTWSADGPVLSSSGEDRIACVLELDRMVLGQILGALLAREDVTRGLLVRPNPSLREVNGRYTFLGRRPAESLVSLPAAPQIAASLRIVGDQCSLVHLRDTLASRARKGTDAAARFCAQLITIGALEYAGPVCDQSENPLDDLIGHLVTTAPDLNAVTADLTALRDELTRELPPTQIEGYRTRQTAIARLLTTIGHRLELNWPPPDVLGKVAFHENAVLPDSSLTASMTEWRPVLDDLDVLRRWLSLHDRMLPVRIALGVYVRHRFGAGATPAFLDMHAAIQSDLARDDVDCPDWLLPLRPFLQLSQPAPPDALEHNAVPELALLHRLRRESLETVLSGERDGAVLRTDPAVLAELAAGWPDWVRPPGSIACYLQTEIVADRLTAVVNTISGGYGKGAGRWSRLLRQGGGQQLSAGRSTPTAEHAPALAELSGTFGVSVNLRAPTAPYEIDYPYTTTARPATERIPLRDLVVRHDPGTGTLELAARPGNRRIQPAHLGMMADPLLPPAARLLLAAFGQSYLLHPSLSLLKPALSGGTRGVEFLPRVEVGRLVVQRAEWRAPIDQVPVVRAGETDAEHLLRLAGWLRVHGIPRRSFVRLHTADGDWVNNVFAKSRKPMFLDLASMSMLAVFQHMTKSFTGHVAFEEALPDPAHARPLTGSEPRVAEIVVELTADGSS